MRIYANVKQAGVRRYAIEKQEINLENDPTTLRDLITEIVTQNVASYNNKVGKQNIIGYLTAEEINQSLETGRLHFGEIYSDKKADLGKALDNAFQSYEDGIYRVFIGDREAGDLDDSLELKENDILTFVRLTMLSGRMW